ncbi:hypothetical protein SCHPADRAFT_406531 [Schizopora paradoxa]|uniref:Uncharacterized protein n=1 Tax=Schizopora paradoxa TaxID=27342 RepID=A0A0H2S754_9AGAM|nr:hypothetical protein SCHPADRAFT_406531 [Schizopora paradoxa]
MFLVPFATNDVTVKRDVRAEPQHLIVIYWTEGTRTRRSDESTEARRAQFSDIAFDYAHDIKMRRFASIFHLIAHYEKMVRRCSDYCEGLSTTAFDSATLVPKFWTSASEKAPSIWMHSTQLRVYTDGRIQSLRRIREPHATIQNSVSFEMTSATDFGIV